MLSYFFPEPKEQSTTDRVCEHLISTLIATINEELPDAEQGIKEIIDKCTEDFHKNIKDNVKNVDAQQVYDYVTTNLVNYISTRAHEIDSNKVACIRTEIKDGKELISLSSELGGKIDKFDQLSRFRKKIHASKKYQKIFKSIKSIVKILALGETGVGKTALVKSLFDLKNNQLRLKGGVESDTEFMKTYQYNINEVTLLYTDSPGFFDTRGTAKAKKNMIQIIEHIKENEIDIILWVARIGDLVTEKHYNLLCKLTKLFGSNVWKKTVVVLTHSNDLPPDEYYENDGGEELNEITAWKAYTMQKKLKWKDTFRDIQKNCKNSVEVPVNLIENSIRRSNKINGVRTLRDGTPFLQELIKDIFTVIKKDKAPIIFLTMAGSCPNNPFGTNQIDSGSILTEHQRSLNNATDHIFHKVISADKKDGWCPIF